MAQPKLRIFAGPNGSGKSTLFDAIKDVYFSTQIFINADLIESQFQKNNFIDLSDFGLEISNDTFISFVVNQGIYKKEKFDFSTWNLEIINNVIVSSNSLRKDIYNSYHFAIISDFLRINLIKEKVSFSFETVFSHPSKLDLISTAKNNGYKVYLYFIGTETPLINEERILDRIKKGGHQVSKEKISERYYRTMELLFKMLKSVDEVYLWDNSLKKHEFIGSLIKNNLSFDTNLFPNWIDKYLIEKL